jgi:hypothetical protein
MKVGTIVSPWRYDAAARHAPQSVNLRRPAILHYASWAAVFPIRRWSGYLPIAALTIDPEIDVMDHLRAPSRHADLFDHLVGEHLH